MASETDTALATAIKQIAQAKVAEALGGDILDKMVSAVMEHRSGYGRNEKTALEEMVEDEIRSMLREVVREQLATHRAKIEEVVSAALTEHANKFATAITDAFVNDDWKATLDITVPRRESDY